MSDTALRYEAENKSPSPHSGGQKRGFAFVIPLYNHARQVEAVLEKAVALGFPTFVVDDGSTDGSYEAAFRVKGATIIRHERNMGKGAALLAGFAAAAKVASFAITVDADGQHEPAEALELIKSISSGKRPIVIGYRKNMDGPHISWKSRFGLNFSNFWVRVSGGLKLKDTQSGFRIYPLPETLWLGAKSRRFQFEVETLALAAWKRIPIIEAPVSVTYPPPNERVSHFRTIRDFWRNAFTFTRLITMRILLPSTFRARLVGDKNVVE